jgi:hypothetical protein
MSDNKYIISLKGPGMGIDSQEIDALQAAKIFVIVQHKISPTANLDYSSTENTPEPISVLESNNVPLVSIREYLMSKNAKTNPEKILVFASYLKNIEDLETFSTKDIRTQFERAAEIYPKNFVRDFKSTLKYGWIAHSNQDKGKYYITTTGERAIESNFSSPKSTSSTKIKKKSGKRVFLPTATIRPEVSKFEIEPINNDLSNYWNLKKKGDRILWILAVAKNANFNELNFKELSSIALKLGDSIQPTSMSALLDPHKKNNRIMTPIQNEIKVIKILEPGIQYLKELKTNTK